MGLVLLVGLVGFLGRRLVAPLLLLALLLAPAGEKPPFIYFQF